MLERILPERGSHELKNGVVGEPLLIPPVNRSLTQSSLGSGDGLSVLPTPPPRTMRKQTVPAASLTRPVAHGSQPRQDSANSYFPSRRDRGGGRGSTGMRSETKPDALSAVRSQAAPPHPELGDEIQQLLGSQRKGGARSKSPERPDNDNKADHASASMRSPRRPSWLRHPPPGPTRSTPSVPQSPRTSVYLPVTHPKDRPIIPRGGLAAAPPPKVKSTASTPTASRPPAGAPDLPPIPKDQHVPNPGLGAGGSAPGARANGMAGVGAGMGAAALGARKWADRLRDRR